MYNFFLVLLFIYLFLGDKFPHGVEEAFLSLSSGLKVFLSFSSLFSKLSLIKSTETSDGLLLVICILGEDRWRNNARLHKFLTKNFSSAQPPLSY